MAMAVVFPVTWMAMMGLLVLALFPDPTGQLRAEAPGHLDFQFEVNKVLHKQLTHLRHTLEAAEGDRETPRTKRTISSQLPLDQDNIREMYLSGVSMSKVYTMAFLQLDDVAFLFTASYGLSRSSHVHTVTIFAVSDVSEEFQKAGHWQVSGPVTLEAISMGSYGFLLVSEEDRNSVPKSYRTEIYSFTRDTTSFVQTIVTPGSCYWRHFRMEDGLFVALLGDRTYHSSGSKFLHIYYWDGAYFDKVYDIPVQTACDVEPFTIQRQSYLAVANCHPDPTEGLEQRRHNSTVVYKFLPYKNEFAVYQHLPGYDTTDVEFLAVGPDAFLAVTQRVARASSFLHTGAVSHNSECVIFRWNGYFFIPYQDIQLNNTDIAKSLQDLQKQDAILVTNTKSNVQTYHLTDGRFEQTYIFSSNLDLNAVKDIHSFHTGNSAYLLFISDKARLFHVTFLPTENLEDLRKDTVEECGKISAELQKVEKNISDLSMDIREKEVQLNMTGLVKGRIFFQNITISQLVKWDDTIVSEEERESVQKYEDLMAEVRLADSISMDIMEALPRYLLRSGDQTFTTEKCVHSLRVKHLFASENLNTEILNEERWSHLVKRILYKNRPYQEVHASLTFPFVRVRGNLTVWGAIDNLYIPEDVVLRNMTNNIFATKVFTQSVVFQGNVDISGTIDDVSLKGCLLTQGDQNVTGFLTFRDNIACEGDIIMEEFSAVQTVDLSEWAQHVVYLQTYGPPIKVGGSSVIDSSWFIEGHVSVNGTINGLDIQEFGRTVMRADVPQVITEDWTVINDITFAKNLTVTGTIQNVSLPGNFALLQGVHVIEGNVVLNNSMTIGDTGMLIVEGMADGILLSDIMTVEEDQEITGEIEFQTSIVLESPSNVTGLVSGMDLPRFAADVLWKSVENLTTELPATDMLVITGVKTFTNDIICQSPCYVDGLVDGVDLDYLYKNTVGPHQPDNVPENVAISSSSFLASLSTDCNCFWKDFIFVDVSTSLQTNLFFASDVSVLDDISVAGLVNGIDMNAILMDAMFTSGPGLVVGSKVFTNAATLRNLHVQGTVDGLNIPDDVMTIGTTQLISGVQTFQHDVQVSLLKAGQLTVRGLTEWNLTDLVTNTLFTHGDQIVDGRKTFAGDCHIRGDLLVFEEIDGVMQLETIAADAVRKDGTVAVERKTEFLDVVISNMTVIGLVDGVDLTYLSPRYILVHNMNQTLRGDRTLLQNVTMATLTLHGLLNGLDVLQMDEEAVKVTDTHYTALVFSDVISHGNVTLQVDGYVDGVDLSEEVNKQEIFGQKTFLTPVHVHGDIMLPGSLIDGVDLSEVANTTVDTTSDQTITGPKTVRGNVHFAGDLVVDGLLNGVLLHLLDSQAVTLSRDHIISDQKRFQNVFITELVVTGTTSGVHLQQINSQRVPLDKTTHITGRKRFTDMTVLKSHLMTSEVILTGLVSGLDITSFSTNVLRKSGSQVINGLHTWQCLVGAESLQLDGTLNSVDLSDIWLTSQPTITIQGKAFGSTVNILGDIQLGSGGTVNGVDISEWAAVAVLTDEGGQVDGRVTVTDVHIRASLWVGGNIDGVDASKLMTLHGDQVITGKKTFAGNVEVSRVGGISLKGLFNKLDMKTLMERAAKLERGSFQRQTHIHGNVAIHGKATFSSSVGSYDPERLRRQHPELVQTYTNVSHNLPLHMAQSCQAVSKLNSFLAAFRLPIQYFESQVLFDQDSISVYGFGHQTQQYVMVCSCQSVTIYKMTAAADQPLIPVYNSTFSPTVHITSYSRANRTYIVTSHDKDNWYPSLCTTVGDSSSAYVTIYEWTMERLIPVQTIPRPPGQWGRGISVEPFWDGTYQYLLITGQAGNEALVYRSTVLRYSLVNGLKLGGLYQMMAVQYRGKIFASASKSSAPDARAPMKAAVYSWRPNIQRFVRHSRINERGVLESRLFVVDDTLHIVLLTQVTSIAHGTRTSFAVYQYGAKNRFIRQQQDSLPSTAKDIQVMTAAGVTYLFVTVERVKVMLYSWRGGSGFVFDMSLNLPGLLSVQMFTDTRHTQVYAVVRTDKTVIATPIITEVRHAMGHISTAVLWGILKGPPVRDAGSAVSACPST